MIVLKLKKTNSLILWLGLIVLISGINSLAIRKIDEQPVEANHDYIREWAIKVSDPIEADLIAVETGFINKGLIPPFDDIYLFVHPHVPNRSKRHAKEHTERLNNHEKVKLKFIKYASQ